MLSLSILSFNPFDSSILLSLLALLGLIICSALISGSETALFSLSPSDIDKVKTSESKVNKTILNLLSKPDSMLATVLIINNLVNICIVVLSNNVLDSLIDFSRAGDGLVFVVKVIIVTFLLLLFGEIMPKIFASYNSLGFARLIAFPLSSLCKIFRPLSRLLIGTGNFINRGLSKNISSKDLSIDVLSDALEITENQSIEEKQMLSGIVSIVSTEVKDIMKSRMDIVAIQMQDDFDTVKKTIIDSGFSRIPVYEQTLDSVKGVLYVKDLLASISQGKDFEWQEYLRQAYFVPDNKKINDLLDDFQASKVHIAIVVDEYGSTLGLVSLEDILEEVVGEIVDESDKEQPSCFVRVDDKTYIFEGKTHLSDFEKIMNLDEDFFSKERGDAETIAGLMLELKRDFIVLSDHFTIKNLKFSAYKLDGRRIDKIKVQIL
ncbi:MAG: gliding motility-associated protein GldE [Rikenellaceae bacterium]